MAKRLSVDVWSDIACPWCYVGKRRLERALASRGPGSGTRIVHRAFLLYGHLPRGASTDRKTMLMSKYGVSSAQADDMNDRIRQVAEAEGLAYRLNGIKSGNTIDAHQLVYLARDHGVQDAMLERLYRAFFIEQRSIFDRDSLVALGAEAGLERGALIAALDTDAYVPAVKADVDLAHQLGVNGVPFFVFANRLTIGGAQSVEVFSRALG